MISGCILCTQGTPHKHSENALELENAKLLAEVADARRSAEYWKAENNAANLQNLELKRQASLEGEGIAFLLEEIRKMTEALNKIHDLAGEMAGVHPHSGAIQAWVHKVLPCIEKRKESTCPACGLGVHGKDALCDRHYGEYLGTNRARGNGPGD